MLARECFEPLGRLRGLCDEDRLERRAAAKEEESAICRVHTAHENRPSRVQAPVPAMDGLQILVQKGAVRRLGDARITRAGCAAFALRRNRRAFSIAGESLLLCTHHGSLQLNLLCGAQSGFLFLPQ